MQRSEVIHASAWQIKVREMRFLTLTMIDVVGIECDEERESEKVAISRKAQNFSILIFSPFLAKENGEQNWISDFPHIHSQHQHQQRER